MSPEDRFWSKVDIRGADECWPWLGSIKPEGYGVFWDGSRKVGAHRYAINLTDSTLDADHQCHNLDLECAGGNACMHRRCCNPNHLEPASRSVNAKRGRTGKQPKPMLRKSHCPAGHPYDSDNTYVNSRGSWFCRECNRERQRKSRREKRSE